MAHWQVADLREYAALLFRRADMLEDERHRLRAHLASTDWQAPNARRFRAEAAARDARLRARVNEMRALAKGMRVLAERLQEELERERRRRDHGALA